MGNSVISLDFIDELRIEGIKYKGYGILPKYVMIDPDLTIEAKGIYAYFCSYAGSGNTAFPSRDKIVADLQINKDTYYKHFNVITAQGYIVVNQSHAHGGRGDGFTKNIYTLVSSPKKFEDKPEDNNHNQAYVSIRFGGLEAAGFGFIPKAVMLDTRLPLKAKAIYAYFCSFTGSGNAAFPKKDTVLFHLGITHNTYNKFFSVLTKLNYITTMQRHIDGRLSVNDYYLNNNPDTEKIIKKNVSVAKKQKPNFSDTQKQDTQKQDTQNWDTNNNKKRNNNFNNNQSINQQATQPPYQAKPNLTEGLSDKKYIDKINNELFTMRNLPYYFLFEDTKLIISIYIITDWIKRNEYYNSLTLDEKNKSKFEHKVFNLFVEALIEMLTPSEPMKIKGTFVTYNKVYEHLISYIKIADEIKTLYLESIEDVSINGFINGCKNTKIKNHLHYMKACIWTALQVGEMDIFAQIKRDFG